MFSNVQEFCEEITKGVVDQIILENYVETITNNHKIEKLKALLEDVEVFIDVYKEGIDADSKDEIDAEIERREKEGIEIPQPEFPEEVIGKLIGYDQGLLAELKSRPEGFMIIDTERLLLSIELKMYDIRRLQRHIHKLIAEQTRPENDNKHEHIFANDGLVLFKELINNHIEIGRGRHRDIIYFYWRMYNDKYIHQRPQRFLTWFLDESNLSIESDSTIQLKTLDEVKNKARYNKYKTALDSFKP